MKQLAMACLLFTATALRGQEFSVSDTVDIVPPPEPELPIYAYSPDGHITAYRHQGRLTVYWPGVESYRSEGKDLSGQANARSIIFKGGVRDFDNGGAWLYSIFPQMGDRLLGFYHAEDHHFPANPESTFIAYKSIARCSSEDGGRTWKKDGKIITAEKPKPEKAEWSGAGDHCIVLDPASKRYFCFFQEQGILRMAISDDPEGRPGSWKKWFEGDFTEPGLGGRATPIAALEVRHGGNPSVHWNHFLECWIMVYHSWEGDLLSTESHNLIDWSTPKVLLARASDREKLWYPTIIGDSDKAAGERATLLYGYFPNREKHERQFVSREIVFRRNSMH